MHKMLEDYYLNYTDFGNRDEELRKNEKYVKAVDEYDEFEEDLKRKLCKVMDETEVFNFVNKLDNLFWSIKDITERDAFELGFNTGIQIAFDVKNDSRISSTQ